MRKLTFSQSKYASRRCCMMMVAAMTSMMLFAGCAETEDGKDGKDGLPGAQGAEGKQGTQGEPGETGEVGPAGPSGTALHDGLKLVIDKVTIANDLQAEVEFQLLDGKDGQLDRTGLTTPGEVTVSFVLAYLSSRQAGATTYSEYVAYTTRKQGEEIQASAESDGTFTTLPTGKYLYKFKTKLPAGFNKALTHTVAAYARRTLPTALGGAQFVANTAFHFRPDGNAVTETREVVSTATCNNCHNPLALHGGQRREVSLCITCHTDKAVDPATGLAKTFVDPDTGNSVDLKVMVHKIHRGADLPSVVAGTPYKIIGFNQSVHDYSGIHFPRAVSDCTSCHKDAAHADNFKTKPSIAACESCHDDLKIADAATTHKGGVQTNDTLCVNCHTAENVETKHRSVFDAPNALKLDVKITKVSLTGTAPNVTPEVEFTVTDETGPRDIKAKPVDRLVVGYNGPTQSKYSLFPMPQLTVQGTGATGTLTTLDAGLGTHRFVFPAAIDISTWMNTYAFVMEGRVVDSAANRFATKNDPYYLAISDAQAVPRAEIVEDQKCEQCHGTLRLHGNGRIGVEGCVMCHNPNANDGARRPKEAGAPESVEFSYMIHKIHRGAELENGYTVYGFGSSKHDFGKIHFPGALQDCETCHKTGTQQKAETAYCISCHDGAAAKAHAELNTTGSGAQACQVCHGAGKEFGVDKVHALAP